MQLPADTSASALFHRLLLGAKEHFATLADAPVPADARTFRGRLGDVVPVFEAMRAASSERTAIARRVALEAASALVYRHKDGRDEPLASHLEIPGDPLELDVQRGRARRALNPAIPFRGLTHAGEDATRLVDALTAAHRMTPPAADAIRWTLARAGSGALDLSGQKFVVLGAGAELAPTPLLLAAGAQVLWIDLRPPSIDPDAHAGTLCFAPGGADLLAAPRDVLATIVAFACDDPIHLGMFAYAAGGGREWRLEASMNALARALPRGMVRSIGIYVSPTSAVVTHPRDVERAAQRWAEAAGWQRACRSLGMLRTSHAKHDDVHVARAVVAVQGASYQATQYVAKILAAEAFASARRVERVSANVAGISRTASMTLPVFQAAFAGARRFDVEVFEPATTRWLSGLLLLHDLLAPDGALDPERLFERQIHGGVAAMPYGLEGAMRVAAVIGLMRRPGLIGGMLRR